MPIVRRSFICHLPGMISGFNRWPTMPLSMVVAPAREIIFLKGGGVLHRLMEHQWKDDIHNMYYISFV